MSRVGLDYEEFDKLFEIMERASDPETVINRVFHDFAASEIEGEIMPLIPRSGRTWSGKKAPAANTKPFKRLFGNMEVTVKTKSPYHYLYFPDDGTSTRRHVGNKQFMQHGGEAAAPAIAQELTEKLIQQISG